MAVWINWFKSPPSQGGDSGFESRCGCHSFSWNRRPTAGVTCLRCKAVWVRIPPVPPILERSANGYASGLLTRRPRKGTSGSESQSLRQSSCDAIGRHRSLKKTVLAGSSPAGRTNGLVMQLAVIRRSERRSLRVRLPASPPIRFLGRVSRIGKADASKASVGKLTCGSESRLFRQFGGLSERFIEAVLKTVGGAIRPGVRIPYPPPI